MNTKLEKALKALREIAQNGKDADSGYAETEGDGGYLSGLVSAGEIAAKAISEIGCPKDEECLGEAGHEGACWTVTPD